MLAALLPELAAAQKLLTLAQMRAAVLADDTPHDSYDFWNGFFDSVNPNSQNYGSKAASRGPTDQLPDPAAETQYLHYNSERSAPLCHRHREGRVAGPRRRRSRQHRALAVSPAQAAEASVRASQFRVDTTQIHPYMNIIAPLAWTAIASLDPEQGGQGLA